MVTLGSPKGTYYRYSVARKAWVSICAQVSGTRRGSPCVQSIPPFLSAKGKTGWGTEHPNQAKRTLIPFGSQRPTSSNKRRFGRQFSRVLRSGPSRIRCRRRARLRRRPKCIFAVGFLTPRGKRPVPAFGLLKARLRSLRLETC